MKSLPNWRIIELKDTWPGALSEAESKEEAEIHTEG